MTGPMDREADLVERVLASEGARPGEAIAPDVGDLLRLSYMLETLKPFTVLEFGCGYSTVVLASKLRELERRWSKISQRPAVRNNQMFRLHTVDTSRSWLDSLRERFPRDGLSNVTFYHSSCEATLWGGQLCHLYDSLPDIVPDFVYVDGPDPAEVNGSVHNLTFNRCPERTVMAADLLLMEPTLLPGCCILFDGRTNNARFLAANFKRNWTIDHDVKGDVTTLSLDEGRLGRFNILGRDIEWPD